MQMSSDFDCVFFFTEEDDGWAVEMVLSVAVTKSHDWRPAGTVYDSTLTKEILSPKSGTTVFYVLWKLK